MKFIKKSTVAITFETTFQASKINYVLSQIEICMFVSIFVFLYNVHNYLFFLLFCSYLFDLAFTLGF